jgi:phage gpG-like protein
MSSSTIYFRGTKSEAKAAVRAAVAQASGREPDTLNIKHGMALAVGAAVLADVKDDFVRKADGGTGEDGNKWPPLAPATIANRRKGPGDAELLKAAGLKKSHRFKRMLNKNTLTKEQQKEWERVYRFNVLRFALSTTLPTANQRARALAWEHVRKLGADPKMNPTRVNVFGGRQVKILRDTGRLMNSLSPGVLSGVGPDSSYTKPTAEGGEEQILEILESGMMVGTNVKYAATHQYGDAERNIPARPFLPDNGTVPDIWLARWAKKANEALAAGIRYALRVQR